jgi:alanine dehydrogenase
VLILHNDDVKQVLTMDMTIDALRQSYTEVATGESACRPRIDFRLPTKNPDRHYQWSTMDGGSPNTGYFASRMNSDIRYTESYGGVQTSEEYCIRPGLWFGIVFLFDIHTAEPLALIQDAYLQRLRVGADAGIGADVIGKEDASVVGILGSGGMARTYLKAFTVVRDVAYVKVYSPTKANRERFAEEMSASLGIQVEAFDHPSAVYEGVDIMASCTDGGFAENPNRAAHLGRYLEPGTHVVSNRGPLDPDTVERIDKALVLGSATTPVGQSDDAHELRDVYAPRADLPQYKDDWYFQQCRELGIANANEKFPVPDKIVYLHDILSGAASGRTSDEQVTFSERGSLQGAQFHAVAGRVYEAARAEGLGREIPTEWLVENERN